MPEKVIQNLYHKVFSQDEIDMIDNIKIRQYRVEKRWFFDRIEHDLKNRTIVNSDSP